MKKTEYLLLIQNGLAYLSQTAFFSLASIYFVNKLHYSLSLTAWMLTYSVIIMRTARLIFSPLANICSFNVLFPYSLILPTLAFLALGFVKNPCYVALLILPIGIGYGLNNILIKHAISVIGNHNNILQRFSRFSISVNLGAAIGPLIGSQLIAYQYQFSVTTFCACVFFLAFIVALITNKNIHIVQEKLSWSIIVKYIKLSKLRNYFIMSSVAWIFYSQLSSSLPLMLSLGLSSQALVGLIFFINAIISIVFPLYLIKITKFYIASEKNIIILALAIYLVGFAVLISPQMILFFVAVIILSLGEILMLPALNSYLTMITPKKERITAFTMSSISMGIGEAIGVFIGTHAIKIGQQHHQWHLPFLLITTITALLFSMVLMLEKYPKTKGV